MPEPNSTDSPPPDEGGNAREQRLDWLITCAADTLHLTGNPRRNFIDYSKRQIIFSPQAAASSIVLAPRKARRLERLRAVYLPGLFFAAWGIPPLVLAHEIGWAQTLILLFLVCWFAMIAWIVTIMSWSAGIPSVYQAMPPPGCAITADADALTINNAIVPWPKIALTAIWMRGGASWKIPESIERLTLRAGGETLMLDRNVVTNGQVLLDTICDKLDMTGGSSQSEIDPQATFDTLTSSRF
jgi:hypothetical protein